MSYALVRRRDGGPHADLPTFAHATGLHPDLLRRLAVLGLLDATADPAGEPWFPLGQLPAAARLERLRAGLGLNYAALGLVVDLLDHIADLEAALRAHSRRSGG
ncbi:chaperone modulator CbpM [Amycolatopsis sp. lyj-90]|uniref:chaperone modulator CbpM n=1 Tax=Amycolatopsis sp. lyj-90 TaxID=2789285 RepID=UPI00397D5481